VKAGERRATIYLHEGSVAFVETSPFEEDVSLGRMLVTTKKITEGALREALERARQVRRPLGRVLVSLGSVTKKVLSEALRDQARAKLEHVLGLKDGTFDWGPWREPPGDADLVLTKGLGILARYVRNRFETLGVGELEAMFGKNMSRVVVLRESADVIATNAGLQQKDLRFLEVTLAAERTISDAITGSPLGRLASLRLVGVALALGIVQFRDGRLQTFVGQQRTRSSVDSPQVAALRRDLKERLALLKDMNHFEVLGVHWSAHYRTYRAPFEKAKRDLDLSKGVLRDAPQDVQELALQVLRVLERAHTALQDEKQRITYRNQFFDKTERQYSADMLVKQGEVALMRGDRVGAIEALETAVELDPSQRNKALLANAREGKG
ncbi:hypothetical protein L6R52_35490, partial [Myxococcota bacterium]|nr:hypothetical protein [Myxococcota bacterium]